MCGICGFSIQGDPDAHSILDGMLTTLHHRGPDGTGTYLGADFAMGNTLLAIVDVGHGTQPFILEWKGEKYICVYNGELYNYKNLRLELEALGLNFTTDCDTEVALASYAAWGPKAVRRFDGQWALAIWAVNSCRIFIARDPFGIKPVYYFQSGDIFAFASEPKALFRHPRISKEADLDAVVEYLLHGFTFAAGYCTNWRSFYKGVQPLPPGHYLLWELGQPIRVARYFNLPLRSDSGEHDLLDLALELRNAVGQSVRDCLMGDVKLSVALSGGLDSSIITHIAAHECARRKAGPLLAACISYDGQPENADAHYAGLLAQSLAQEAPIDLVYSRLEPENYLADLDKMIWHFDEPHWEPKQLAMFNNYRTLRKQGAKIVNTGEGGDELFFGYYHRFPGFLRPIINSVDDLRTAWSRRTAVAGNLLSATLRGNMVPLMNYAIDTFYKPYQDAGLAPAKRMQAWYLHTFLHWLLLDNDRCSMAHSLEGRFPYLNRSVYELALSIPASMQVGPSYGEEKLPLRKAFESVLPIAIVRRAKAPLPSPTALSFHKSIGNGLFRAIQEVPKSIWEALNKAAVQEFAGQFRALTDDLEQRGHTARGGEELTRYLFLEEGWGIRTPQAFGLLTLLRWWTINFS
jgi:asparagine synthase (glutamine-hydrolysing)